MILDLSTAHLLIVIARFIRAIHNARDQDLCVMRGLPGQAG